MHFWEECQVQESAKINHINIQKQSALPLVWENVTRTRNNYWDRKGPAMWRPSHWLGLRARSMAFYGYKKG